ncbi:MAG: threonylcarbamoyl-AMP synthase [Ruminococcaceae bacterium]|nr:threonylcarbamoyl-AMP synthase [Oscillospiraceae bacterium]
MVTEIFKVDKDSYDILKKAAALVRSGELVAIPTETVYGLGANAFDKNACLNIFKAKGRPGDNPLIVHIARPEDAEKIAYTNPLYYKLADKLMPGPLTIILPKKDVIPSEVTAGLDSVAIRCPVHPVASALIEMAGVPIAAPSANSSGKPSPTTANHVFDDMAGKIPLILDGGVCDVGVESTVIKITENEIILLRPGAVTLEMLKEFCENVSVAGAVKEELKAGEKPLSPGMKYKHYAPRADLYLIDDKYIDFVEFTKEKQKSENCAIMCYDEEIKLLENKNLLPVGNRDDIKNQTKQLFILLREADKMGVDTIYAHLPNDEGESLAIYNRMIRACAHRIIK